MFRNLILVTILLSFNLLLIESADLPSACNNKYTCGSCVSNVGCMWCAHPTSILMNEDSIPNRCVHVNKQEKGWCPENEIIYPNSPVTTVKNSSLQSNTNGDAVQISPQLVKISVKIGEEIEIPLKYQAAEDYPVDLYFLMDLSSSMSDDKEKLSELGMGLIDSMKKITTNFRIGFGSFSDKVEMPFTFTTPEKLINPCSRATCSPPYNFKNQLPLTHNTHKFSVEIKNSPITGNIDVSESGFDALMQVIVCQKEIGWREKARKIVVFATDDGFHIAGDGKLAGIIEPNDRMCHLDESGLYTYSLLQDYPSISMLDMKVRENNINVIFAATDSEKEVYEELLTSLHGSSYGILSDDSSNVIELIKAQYEKLVSAISLSDDSEEFVEIRYFSKCLGTEERETNECKSLQHRPEINFKAVLKAIKCPENKNKWHQVINIKPGALNETLTLEVDIICSCDCENEQVQIKSEECSNGGSLQCGICSCDSERYGKFCECDGNKLTSSKQEDCKPTNTTDQICSGLGFCKCGKCECNKREDTKERIYGTYCECDNFSCKKDAAKKICSGPERGRCDCGKCICELGWSGSACECRENTLSCISPKSGKVCSGNGVCECGSCKCNRTNEFRFSGDYCEECPYCTETKCGKLKDCVECKVHKSGKYSESECSLLCDTKYEIKEIDRVENEKKTFEEIICKVPDSSSCTTVFKYMYADDDQLIKIYAEKTKQCPGEVDLVAMVLGVVGSILLASLVLLLIWKIVTTVHDRREFAKFERERAGGKWGNENPMYKPSIFSYRNPLFGKSTK